MDDGVDFEEAGFVLDFVTALRTLTELRSKLLGFVADFPRRGPVADKFKVSIDGGRTHRQQFGTHLFALAAFARDQIPVSFEVVKAAFHG